MPKKLKKIIKLCSMVFVIGILTLLLPEKGAADYPIFSQRFTADPAAVVYNGRLYIYCSMTRMPHRPVHLQHPGYNLYIHR